MLYVAVTPALVYAIALGALLVWVLRLWPVGQVATFFVFLCGIQVGAACLALWLTAQNPISEHACMLGLTGMMANMAYFGSGALTLVVTSIFVRDRLSVLGGIRLPSVLLLVTAVSALVHTRSALLCTV